MTNVETLQLQLPGLADQALAETAVRLAGDKHESGLLINLAPGDQNALGPQRDRAIAAGPRKGDALSDQPFAQSMSAPGRVDQQQSQFGDLVAVSHEKYRADRDAIEFGDPAALPRSVEGAEKFRGDFRDQRLEGGVKTVFAGVERAM